MTLAARSVSIRIPRWRAGSVRTARPTRSERRPSSLTAGARRISKWGVYDRETGELVGRGGLAYAQIDGARRLEIGWTVRDAKVGQGYVGDRSGRARGRVRGARRRRGGRVHRAPQRALPGPSDAMICGCTGQPRLRSSKIESAVTQARRESCVQLRLRPVDTDRRRTRHRRNRGYSDRSVPGRWRGRRRCLNTRSR